MKQTALSGKDVETGSGYVMAKIRKRKSKEIVFKGNWLGGSRVELKDSLATVHRIILQVPKDAYEELLEMTARNYKLTFTVTRYKGDE